jgi:hypothetical protein
MDRKIPGFKINEIVRCLKISFRETNQFLARNETVLMAVVDKPANQYEI